MLVGFPGNILAQGNPPASIQFEPELTGFLEPGTEVRLKVTVLDTYGNEITGEGLKNLEVTAHNPSGSDVIKNFEFRPGTSEAVFTVGPDGGAARLDASIDGLKVGKLVSGTGVDGLGGTPTREITGASSGGPSTALAIGCGAVVVGAGAGAVAIAANKKSDSDKSYKCNEGWSNCPGTGKCCPTTWIHAPIAGGPGVWGAYYIDGGCYDLDNAVQYVINNRITDISRIHPCVDERKN